jgi:hypothetical protein
MPPRGERWLPPSPPDAVAAVEGHVDPVAAGDPAHSPAKVLTAVVDAVRGSRRASRPTR